MFRRLTPLLLLPALCGCVAETQNGSATTYAFEWWTGVLSLVGGLLLTAGGVLLLAKFGWRTIFLSIVGLALLFVVTPSQFSDKVVVDDEHFELHTGFWFDSTDHTVRFADLRQIDLTTETTRGRRGRKNTSYYLVCLKKTGVTEKVPVGTLMRPATEKQILARAEAKGVAVIDLQGPDGN